MQNKYIECMCKIVGSMGFSYPIPMFRAGQQIADILYNANITLLLLVAFDKIQQINNKNKKYMNST